MFRFADPQYLFLLAVIPLLLLLRFLMMRHRRKLLRRLGDASLLVQLMPDVSRWRPGIKFSMLLTAWALMCVMMARPQQGVAINKEKRAGIETLICMDVSNSMLATDVAPSRLDRCKMMVENMIDKFHDDKIGLIVFAGDAFVQLPITSDFVSAKMFLGSISPSLINTQGTDIARAISMASQSFTKQQGVGRAIIIITDGENHEGGALEAAKEAAKQGLKVYVLGVGTTSGAPIPVGNGDFMKDHSGQTVMTALNEQMCREIAQAGGGTYIHVENNSDAQRKLEEALSTLARKEMETTIYSDYAEQFQAFGLLALLLLVLEVMVRQGRNPLSQRFQLFRPRRRETTMLMLACLSLFPLTAGAQGVSKDRALIRQGNTQFRKERYAEAEVSYRKALEHNANNPQAMYNLGNALLAQNKDSMAAAMFEKSVLVEKSPLRKAITYHNMGVLAQKNKLYGDAINYYKQSLRLNPSDEETRYNLALCKRLQKQQEKDKNQQNQDNKDNQDKNQQNQQKQQEKQDKQQDKQQEKQQPKPDNKMSKENAEQMLNAAMQQERNTQERMKEKMQQPRSRVLEKNW